jgi:arsenate reductase (glutaredoxin)
MPNGTVKFFNVAKGFGFITSDEGGKEIFLPAAALASAGLSGLKMGQRVSFEAIPDSKGPKATNITLLADAVSPKTDGNAGRPAMDGGKERLTFYHDPSLEESRTALQELQGAGHQPRIIEYLATPPDKDQLKHLSLLLRGTGQNLVKKYDPLFLALSLDDRFISEGEFWQAIVEHSSLINGPIVASATKAALCGSKNAIAAFLAPPSSAAPAAAQQKTLPASILAMMGITAKPAEKVQDGKNEAPKPVAKAAKAARTVSGAKPVPEPEARRKSATAAKPRTKPSAAPKTKPKPRVKAPAKVAAKKSSKRGR